MEFSVASESGQDLGSVLAQTETKTPKPATQSNPIKTPLSNPQVKTTQVARTPNFDGSNSGRKEEESAFWKISMERSRIEGSQSEFQSLTPSQIKSLEKGEKPLPVYYRQDSFQKEKEVAKPEKTSLLIEKPVVITKQPKTTIPSVVSLENPRPSESSVSTVDDVFLPEPVEPVTESSKEPNNDDTFSTEPQLFAQVGVCHTFYLDSAQVLYCYNTFSGLIGRLEAFNKPCHLTHPDWLQLHAC